MPATADPPNVSTTTQPAPGPSCTVLALTKSPRLPGVPFTSEAARLAGIKSAVLRAQRRSEAKQAIQPNANGQPNPPATQANPNAPDVCMNGQRASDLVAKRTWAQLERLDKLLDKVSDPQDADRLTRSKERLWKVWAHAAQVPSPGNFRPSMPVRRSSLLSISVSPSPGPGAPEAPAGHVEQAG